MLQIQVYTQQNREENSTEVAYSCKAYLSNENINAVDLLSLGGVIVTTLSINVRFVLHFLKSMLEITLALL